MLVIVNNKLMSISQSRANNRGPLIAVIKIQIEEDQIDRIFLHQNDDDYKLAEEFQQKHNLNPLFIQHIYQRIRASRQSLQKESQFYRSPLVHNTQRSNNTYAQSNCMGTPGQFDRDGDRQKINKEFQNTYRNYYDNISGPIGHIDRVAKFTTIPQDIVGNIVRSGQFRDSRDPNVFHQPSTIENSYKNKETIDYSTFEAFIQKAKINNNHDIFQKYSKERKQEKNEKNEVKKLIEKASKTDQILYKSEEIIQRQKLQSNDAIPLQEAKIRKNRIQQSQDKPLRVKILKKDKIQQFNTEISKQKIVNKLSKQKIIKQVTTRLYNELDIKKNYLNKIKERAKQKKQVQDNEQLTYKPQINKISQLIASNRYKFGEIQDYLISQAKKIQIKKQNSRAISAQRQMENCSFKPCINTITQKLVQSTSKNYLKNKCTPKNYSCSKKHSHSQTTFKPLINKMSQQIVKNKYNVNFQQRLKGYLQNKNNKLNELTREKLKKQKVDEKGQKLFHPRTYSKPLNRSPKGTQIHDYLYEMSKINKEIPTEEHKPIISENSQQIVQQMYIKRIAWLFSQLDSDQDGLISPKRTSIDTISSQLLQIIAPILFEMEQLNVELNLLQFINAIKNLHVSLNAHQKSILYNYCNKNQQSQTKSAK